MDEIQQKIEEFKQDLQSQSPLKEIFLSCPAVLPAVGLIIGLVLQYYFNLPLLVWFGFLILSIILYLPLFCRKTVISTEVSPDSSGRAKRRNLFFYRFLDFGIFDAFARNDKREFLQIFISIFLCFICLGGIRLISQNKPFPNDIRNIVNQDSSFARIRAQIISAPAIVENNDWFFAKNFPSTPYTTFYAKVTDIKTASGWMTAAGTIKFYISEDINSLNLGDKFESFCRLEKFSPADNPGQFDIAAYMNNNGVYLSASVKTVNTITTFGTENFKSPFDIKVKLHNLAVTALNGNTEPDDDMRLVEALLLGSRTKINRPLYNDFIKTGLVHLVALSGMNVGILAGFFWWLSKKAGLLHKGRSIACIIATIIFILVVPSQSSILRAGIMFAIFCLARLFNRQSKTLNSLALSLILLLLIRPIDFLDASFQLSFAAVLGILLFYEPIKKYLSVPIEPLRQTPFYLSVRMPLYMFAVGLAAWTAIIPLIAWHFYQFQTLTSVWTVPAVIPATVITVLGTLKILLNPLLPTLAYGLSLVIDFSAKILAYLVTLFAKVPFTSIIIGKPSIYIVLLFYILLFLWKFFPFKRSAKNYIYPAAITFLLIFTVLIAKFEKFGNLQLTVLSVGHGQAIYLKTPDSKNFIIDAGSITNTNIGEKIVNPFLNYIAADKIDSVFVSHDDIDHYNGLPEILDKHKCKNAYTTPQFIQNAATSPADARLIEFIKSKNIPLCVSPEKISSGKVIITRLWPRETPDENSLMDNQSSLVLLIEYAGRKILSCSDITADIQKQLMVLYPRLDIDLMITPHHGSARTADSDFINAFKPEFLITSCSESRLSSVDAQIKEHSQSYYTCSDGAITVLIDSAGKIKLSHWTNLAKISE